MCSVWIAGVSAFTNQSEVSAAPAPAAGECQRRRACRPPRRLVLLAGRAPQERRQREHEERQQHAGADERQRFTVRFGRRVERMGERRDRHRRRGEHGQRRDQPGAARVEALGAVLQPADDERDTEHEHAVREDRTDQRRLDDLDEPLVQREQRDEELRQVAERRLDDAGAAGTEPRAQLLGRGADQAGERGERRGRDDERRTSSKPREMADRRASDGGGGEAELDAGRAGSRRRNLPTRLVHSIQG